MLLHKSPLRLRPLSSSGLALALAVAIQIAIVGLAASDAQATPMTDDLPGLTLADLAAGASFESANGMLSFSNFEIETEGTAPADLDAYRIVAVSNGFKIFSPLFGLDGDSGSLSLQYKVSAIGTRPISSAEFSVLGVAAKGGTEIDAEFFDMGGASAGDLFVAASGPGVSRDQTGFDPMLSMLMVDELVTFEGDGLDGLKHIEHRFRLSDTTVIPEPGTALLLGLGLSGLAIRRRSETGAA